nr:hypothetical protein GCM10025732_12610 [Glycomyces mayteni]
MVPPGTEVTLTVSAGGQATVPDVFGMVVDTAISTLENAGFDYVVEYGSGGTTVGVVYSQSPSKDSTESKGATVTITAQGVVVSWDASTTPQALMDTLNGLGLDATVNGDATLTTIESVSGPDGQLTSGTAVAPGSVITIVPAADDGGGGGDETATDEDTCMPPLCQDDGA